MLTVVVGLQWGDEGKGKVISGLGSRADWIVRVNGGPNAGHTVGGTKVHQVPPGIEWPGSKLAIAPGSVVDVPKLLDEVDRLEREGFDVRDRLLISDRAHLIRTTHRVRDVEDEEGRGEAQIGTTRTGNGPVHADKYARVGTQLGQDEEARRSIEKAGILIGNVPSALRAAVSAGKDVVLMVAHGTMLDINHGTYPYVTSSHVTVAGALDSAGIPPDKWPMKIIGVAKAYTTRVAPGFMRGEVGSIDAQVIRDKGNEYGTTTGRPRRIGWIDWGQLRYAAELNGVDEIWLTKADTLVGLPVIAAVNGTWDDPDPSVQALQAIDEEDFERAGPGPLPAGLQAMIKGIEAYTGAPVMVIGTGPGGNDVLTYSAWGWVGGWHRGPLR